MTADKREENEHNQSERYEDALEHMGSVSQPDKRLDLFEIHLTLDVSATRVPTTHFERNFRAMPAVAHRHLLQALSSTYTVTGEPSVDR